MKSRIVQPSASFQPPETCTEHEECQAAQTPPEDLRKNALEHYDKVSTAAHEWHSAIPKAIDVYYADPERSRLEREVIEAVRKWHHNDKGLTRIAIHLAMDALINFESQHTTDKP